MIRKYNFGGEKYARQNAEVLTLNRDVCADQGECETLNWNCFNQTGNVKLWGEVAGGVYFKCVYLGILL